MAANRWKLNDNIKAKFEPQLRAYFQKVENLTVEQVERMENHELGIDFSDKGINPAQLEELLEQFGYEEESTDQNGWEMDFWIRMKRKDGRSFPSTCERLVINGCGMTFELKLYIEDMDF